MLESLKKRAWIWIGLVLLGLNALLLSTYQVTYQGQVAQLQSQIEESRNGLVRLQQERERREQMSATIEETRDDIRSLYGEGLGTERRRLTALLGEVKDLAERAGLTPGNISYPEESIERYDLINKQIVFGVEGDYQKLRRFINFLELTDSFLVLEEISLSESAPNLRIGLRLSTLFAQSEDAGLTAETGADA